MKLIELAEKWEQCEAHNGTQRYLGLCEGKQVCARELRSALSDLAQEDPEGLVEAYREAIVVNYPPDEKLAEEALLAHLSLLRYQRDQWQSTAELHAQETLAAQAELRTAEEQRDAAVALVRSIDRLAASDRDRNLGEYSAAEHALDESRLRYELVVRL